jgi:hypothetical protein
MSWEYFFSRKVMTETICHTILLDLLVIFDLLVTHHSPEQASYIPHP